MYKLQSSIPPFYLLLNLLFLSSILCYDQVCDQQDQSSLLTFYDSIRSSSPPLNWSTSISCCQWEGIDCDNNGRVTHLQLSSRALDGVITSSIRNLVCLTHLNLSNNTLSGFLPNGLFELMDSLEVIDLSSNHLHGNFSSSLPFGGSFPLRVKTFDISNNLFEGSIGQTWFLEMELLTNFNCSKNEFNGSIPTFICLSSSLLNTLDLSHNQFSGSISKELKECSQLQVFRATFNSIFGSIPAEIGELSYLRVIDLSYNRISGTIPQKIGNLLHLEKLYLHDNDLSGNVPSSLMRCRNLTDLILRNNILGGEISKLDWSGLFQLQKLDLRNNSLNGSLPESIYSCKSLIAYAVSHNNFSGSISTKIVNLKSLSFLSLASNSFTNITKKLTVLSNCQNLSILLLGDNFHGEALPSNISFLTSTSFPNLRIFTLDHCNLTGFFPEWLSHIKTLQTLSISSNQITGKIPHLIGTLPRLFILSFYSNNLFGEIPQSLCWLPALQVPTSIDPKSYQIHFDLPLYAGFNVTLSTLYTSFPSGIDLGYNKLSGEIPLEIGNLLGLQRLYLENNNFSGHIPPSISNLKNLQVVDLSENKLMGEIPTSLKDLHFLAKFSVANNDLQGPIPTGGQFDTFDESSYEGNPRLCGELLNRPCSITPSPNAKILPLKSESDGMKFLDGLFVGLVSGFSGVLIIVASYFWFKICSRCSPL